uniref:Hydroxylamine reductase n=1 Tax=Vitrella brassicaformis TaxID=1169539 RepID=A0A7S1JK54_9ALVE
MAVQINYLVMKLLSEANATFGEPEPTEVPVRPKPGKCILVTGHDLSMLHDVLEATKDRGIQVYTHGELMPAHTYPKLKAYPHLAGHFGGAWQNQRRQFSKFPGAILVTTNCLMPLIHKSPYKDRIFTTGVCGGEDIQHLESTKDLSKLIQAAEAAPGFTEADTEFNVRDPVQKHMPPSFHVGHSYQWIVKNAQTVLKLIQEGKIKRFYLVGGCDGSEGERSFYTDLVKQLPQTSVVMTLGCGKYRINHLEEGMGKIDGTLPRLLDLGQCNDAFGAIQVALTLADALNCGVNDLPLSIVLSWFEQKAVAVLLTLLFLKVKPLYIGPKLPGFLTKNVLDVLSRDFGLVPLATEHEVEAKMSPPEWGTFQQLVSLAA